MSCSSKLAAGVAVMPKVIRAVRAIDNLAFMIFIYKTIFAVKIIDVLIPIF
jgi:hypothetical protein